MKFSLEGKALDNLATYRGGLAERKLGQGIVVLSLVSVTSIVSLDHRVREKNKNLALLSALNTPCSLEDSAILDRARNYALRISREIPFGLRDTNPSIFDFDIGSDEYRRRFELALVHNEFRCSTLDHYDGYAAIAAFDAEFNGNGDLLKPGVVSFFPHLNSFNGDDSTKTRCSLVGIVAHETVHTIALDDREAPAEIHDSQQDDVPYKVGRFFTELCLTLYGR